MAKRRHVFFSALCPKTEEQIKKKRKTKLTLTCSFEKVIRTLILLQTYWYSWIAISVSFKVVL